MKPSILLVGFLCLAHLGCSSDSSPKSNGAMEASAGTQTGTAGGAGSTVAAGGSSNAGSAGSAVATGGASNAGSAGSTVAAGGAGMTGSAGAPANASADCIKYCTCHETNCAGTAIPGGKSCYDFCAAFTVDQLSCRQNMCNLVPAQPDNDHCTHSVGLGQQCL